MASAPPPGLTHRRVPAMARVLRPGRLWAPVVPAATRRRRAGVRPWRRRRLALDLLHPPAGVAGRRGRHRLRHDPRALHRPVRPGPRPRGPRAQAGGRGTRRRHHRHLPRRRTTSRRSTASTSPTGSTWSPWPRRPSPAGTRAVTGPTCSMSAAGRATRASSPCSRPTPPGRGATSAPDPRGGPGPTTRSWRSRRSAWPGRRRRRGARRRTARVLYRGAVALVHPSEAEGFGLTVLEALAAGCPVVASRIPATVEVGGDLPHYSTWVTPTGSAPPSTAPSAPTTTVAAGRARARRTPGTPRPRRPSTSSVGRPLTRRGSGRSRSLAHSLEPSRRAFTSGGTSPRPHLRRCPDWIRLQGPAAA